MFCYEVVYDNPFEMTIIILSFSYKLLVNRSNKLLVSLTNMVLPSVAFPVINLFHRCIKTTTSFILPHRNITCTYCLIHICMKMNLSLFHFFSLGTGCSFLIFSLRGRMLLPLSTDGMEHLCIVNTEAWTKSSGRYYAL